MNINIHKGAEVFTADGFRLGQAVAVFQRLEDVNPALKLFEYYLKVTNLEMWDEFFIPLEYIDKAGEFDVTLSIDMKKVQEETLSRMPKFIANHQAKKIELAPGELLAV
jgi:hypothetical protein